MQSCEQGIEATAEGLQLLDFPELGTVEAIDIVQGSKSQRLVDKQGAEIGK